MILTFVFLKFVQSFLMASSTLLRLERIMLLLKDVCQSSHYFCMTLGRTRFVQVLDDMVQIFSVHDIYSGLSQVCI